MERKPQSTESKLDHKSVELRSLFELSQILNSSLDINRVLNNCLLTPMGRMLISRGFALTADENGGFEIKVTKGLSPELVGHKIQFLHHFDHPVLLRDLAEDECPNKEFFLSKQMALLVPMISTNRMVGALCLGSKITQQDFAKNELQFLNSLSNIAAAAIENALMFQKLEAVNRRLDKKLQELNTLFDIGKELNATLDREKIINILLFTIMGEMAVNKLLLFFDNNGVFELAANRGVNNSSPLFQSLLEPAALAYLARQKSPGLISAEVTAGELYLLKKLGIKVIVPLHIQQDTKGVLLLGPKMSGAPYGDDEVEFLSTLGNRVMISLENARLFEEALEKQRLEEEIAIARDIQQRLLPRYFPQHDSLEIYGFNVPSRQVGGDYFDCFELDGDHIALAIGDVSGKGVGASLLMSNLHAGLHTLVDSRLEKSAILAKLNNLIYENTGFDKFITFFYAEYEPNSRQLSYVNAGHNPPYVFHADGSFVLLEEGGLLLGMMPNQHYDTGQLTLAPGDLLISFTDGVTEAKNKAGDMYEEKRLEKLIGDSLRKDVSVEVFANILINELNAFAGGTPQADDITMLGLKIK